ncbi:HNH/ENDO VII family nuclease, partial [Priestia flexa]
EDPKGTLQSIGEGAQAVWDDPKGVAKTIGNEIKDSWNEQVINGDAKSRGHYFSYLTANVAMSIVGTKGADKLAKTTKFEQLSGAATKKLNEGAAAIHVRTQSALQNLGLNKLDNRLAYPGVGSVKGNDGYQFIERVDGGNGVGTKVRDESGKGTGKSNLTNDIYKVTSKDVQQAIQGYEQTGKFTAQFKGFEVKAQRSLSNMSDKQLIYSFKKGYAPKDGVYDTIILHHHEQRVEGPIIEMPSRYHDLGNKRQHPFGNKGGVGSGEARQEFNKWRKEYWKARYANEMIKRGIIE